MVRGGGNGAQGMGPLEFWLVLTVPWQAPQPGSGLSSLYFYPGSTRFSKSGGLKWLGHCCPMPVGRAWSLQVGTAYTDLSFLF